MPHTGRRDSASRSRAPPRRSSCITLCQRWPGYSASCSSIVPMSAAGMRIDAAKSPWPKISHSRRDDACAISRTLTKPGRRFDLRRDADAAREAATQLDLRRAASTTNATSLAELTFGSMTRSMPVADRFDDVDRDRDTRTACRAPFMRIMRTRSPKSSSANARTTFARLACLLRRGHRVLEVDAHGVGLARRGLRDERPLHARARTTCFAASSSASADLQHAQHFVGVLAERGHCAHARRDVSTDCAAESAPESRRSAYPPCVQRLRAASCGCVDDRRHVVHRRRRNVGALERGEHVSRGIDAKSLLRSSPRARRDSRRASRSSRNAHRRPARRRPAPASQKRRHSRSV